MPENRVERLLLEKSASPDTLFVFPTDVAASRWADRLLTLRGGGSLALEQFTAWDTFKKDSIRSRKQDKKSIPGMIRKIFISSLLRKNAELAGAGGTPLFSSLVPPLHAEGASSFASWFCKILPQLGAWHERAAGKDLPRIAVDDIPTYSLENGFTPDERDLLVLALRYRDFLDREGLFEPSWEKPPFDDTGKDCYIFFPECLSDFGEYRELLESTDRVTLVELNPSGTGGTPPASFFYTNSRSEITEAALYIRSLAERENIPWDSIVVSLPDAEEYEPYVLREFANRNIPVVSRRGKPLGSYPAGRFFSALGDCYSGGFSFDTLSALLLNTHLPWRDSAAINQLVDFGIQNNCICSWKEGGGRDLDVWLDAFSSAAGSREKRAEDFYRNLKRDITAINGAVSFAELRQRYFIFREHFFDMDNCPAETDLVLSRCIAELLTLIEIEKLFPRVTAPDPYRLFTEHLSETSYLPRQETAGVSLLPYRTAAPVPFDCHIILGASQENLSAIFPRLDFLPRPRREALGISDTDASEAFINLHCYNSAIPAAFFCAEETFSGFAIPHPKIGAEEKPSQRLPARGETGGGISGEDFFQAERQFHETLWPGAVNPDPEGFPGKLHAVQAAGFSAWRGRRQRAAASPRTMTADQSLLSLILNRYGSNTTPGAIRVSATAMKIWHQCSLAFLFERILYLQNIRMETTLMAENILGSLYHALLDAFFQGTQRIDGGILAFRPGGGLVPAYRELLRESASEVFSGLPRLGNERRNISALTVRLLRAEAEPVVHQAEKLLEKFTGYFAGFRVLGSELELAADEQRYCLTGKVDCLLEDCREDAPSPGARVIADFKLKTTPSRNACLGRGGKGLEDYQLPMYITLAEKDGGEPVQTALFFSILDIKPLVILGTITDPETRKTSPYLKKDRVLRNEDPEYATAILDECSAAAARFAAHVQKGVFEIPGGKEQRCYSCAYRRVCRTVYSVDRDFWGSRREA